MRASYLRYLKEIVELLGPNGENWTQCASARNSQSIPVGVFDEDAVKFCAIGAITKVTRWPYPYSEELVEFIKSAQPVQMASISKYNDNFASWEDISTMFKNAITKAEKL